MIQIYSCERKAEHIKKPKVYLVQESEVFTFKLLCEAELMDDVQMLINKMIRNAGQVAGEKRKALYYITVLHLKGDPSHLVFKSVRSSFS